MTPEEAVRQAAAEIRDELSRADAREWVAAIATAYAVEERALALMRAHDLAEPIELRGRAWLRRYKAIFIR